MTLTSRILRKAIISIGVLTVLPVLPVADASATGAARAALSRDQVQLAPARVAHHVM